MLPITVGYYVVNDGKYGPNETLDHAVLAEEAGFNYVWTSDHFAPFTHEGMNAPFTWVWIASAAERTARVQLATAVTSPILRYPPAIVAQAFATLGVIYPGRISLGLGVGESINEYPIGYSWPSVSERIERLSEAVQIINKMWTEDFVTFKGTYFELRAAHLYNKPKSKIPVYLASTGPRVAGLAGRYAEGHIHPVGIPKADRIEKFKSVIRPAIERGARAAGRDPASVRSVGTLTSSYAKDPDQAAKACVMRRGTLVPGLFTEEFKDPRGIERLASSIPDAEVVANTLIADGEEAYIRAFEQMIAAGFAHVYVSNWGPDPAGFFDLFKRKAIPYLRETGRLTK